MTRGPNPVTGAQLFPGAMAQARMGVTVLEGRGGRTGCPVTRRGGPGKSVGIAGWAGGTRQRPTQALPLQLLRPASPAASGFWKEGQYIW